MERITVGDAEIGIELYDLPSAKDVAKERRNYMDSLPFCRVTIHGVRCPHGPHFRQVKGYPAVPKTIGEMIRKRRLDLGLHQIEVAEVIGCDEMSIVNWERGHTAPRINYMAGVTRFLGCNPFPSADTLAERLLNRRKAFGITQKEFAREIRVDPSTLARWERSDREPKGRFQQIVEALF